MSTSPHTADLLRAVIKDHGIQVSHLSRTLGIGQQHFYKYISQNPKYRIEMSAEKLGKILRALPDKAKLEFLENFAYEKTD